MKDEQNFIKQTILSAIADGFKMADNSPVGTILLERQSDGEVIKIFEVDNRVMLLRTNQKEVA